MASHGDEVHVFYLQAPRSLGDPRARHRNATVGHAVSTDLRRWTVLPDALGRGPAGSFDDLATWTGSVLPHDGRWRMFYTGVSTVDDGMAQRIGMAESFDLVRWRRMDAPPLAADPRWYEKPGPPGEEAWRDPWVFADETTGLFHMLITARSRSGPLDGRGVIGHASSPDLDVWAVGPPLSEPGEFTSLEVPQLVSVEGTWYVLFSAQAHDHSAARLARPGVVAEGGTALPARKRRARPVPAGRLGVPGRRRGRPALRGATAAPRRPMAFLRVAAVRRRRTLRRCAERSHAGFGVRWQTAGARPGWEDIQVAAMHTGLHDVTAAYDSTVALRSLTLDAAPGELLVVLGPSGCGKSTLLRVLAGLHPVRSGQVFIDGRDVTGLAPQQRNVAMVFESDALVPFMDVARNMGWTLRARQVPAHEAAERVASQAAGLGLSRLLKRLPGTLSAGERGVAGIGRALVHRPSLSCSTNRSLTLTTPAAPGAPPDHRGGRRRLGVTSVYSTHDQRDAMAMADRVALLRDGALVQLDTPQNLYHRPVNLFTAEFIGSPGIGLLPARLIVAGGLAGYQVGARVLPLWRPVPPELRDQVGAEVLLGLRAEHVRDASRQPEPEVVAVRAIVTGVEHTGRETVVTAAAEVALDGPGELRSVFPRGSVVSPGDVVELGLDVTRASVFDPSTGRARWHPEP